MIVSFPCLNYMGQLNGAELTFRLEDISAIEHMVSEDHSGERIIEDRLIPGGVTIYLPHTGGGCDIQANYDELKAKIIALNEWNEVT